MSDYLLRQPPRTGLAIALVLILPGLASALSLFQVGNSFTFDSKPLGTEAMLEARLGIAVDVGYHVRGNQSLDSLWNNPNASGTELTDFGDHTVALPNSSWDYLTVQTFQTNESSNTLGQEVARIQDFVGAADLGSGGDTEIIVYGPWAGRSEGNWGRWNDPAPADPDFRVAYSSAYHDTLHDEVAALYPGRVRLASAGKVIREMRDQIIAGEAPLATTSELYRDTIHLSDDIGRYVASSVIQTSILGRSQVGQPVPEGVEGWNASQTPADLLEWIQLTVWEVMLADSRSGVIAPDPGDFNGDGEIDLADYDLFTTDYGSIDRLLADGNGNGQVDAADYTIWRDAYNAATGISVPEPAGLFMTAICLLIAARRRVVA